MNCKIFVIAALFAILLVKQSACEEEFVQPDELYILNPGSEFPLYVTDPNSPMLSPSRQIVLVCNSGVCQSRCRSWGYRIGRCIRAVCYCSR